MKGTSSLLLTSLSLSVVHAAQLSSRQGCEDSYQLCSPPGATSNAIPDIGRDLSSLYKDILDTVNPQASPGADGTTCLLLLVFAVPICYDAFTTNFFLPDGSYGTVEDGNFTAISGAHANLITGDYRLGNGQSGNIYAATPASQPNTSTLAIPTPYTSSGVGAAIPASQLGAMTGSTTAGPESYPPAFTTNPSAVSASTLEHRTTLGNASTVASYTSLVTTTDATLKPSIPAAYTANQATINFDQMYTTLAVLLVSLAVLGITVVVL